MASDNDQDPEPEWLRKHPLRSEEIGFSPDELIECRGCGRWNAPNRPTCLYCGSGLEGVGITKFDIREPESWESGFNVVIVDAIGGDAESAAVELASLLHSERESVKALLKAGKMIPLARVETENQAVGISEKLAVFGIKTMVVADEWLRRTSPPTRLKSINFDGNQLKLELFSLGEVRSLESDALALIVPGVILEGRTESIERRKRRVAKTVSESAISSDEPVIDIYSNDDPTGWRIRASGFDFSCLGPDKSMLVAENMNRLSAKLVEFSPAARLVDDYVKVRSFLEYAWPSESRRDKQHVALNRKEVSNVFTTNNTMQLTKYSRLQWRLYEKEV